MKRLLFLAFSLVGAANLNALTIMNNDSQRHEIHALDANGTNWKFYIQPGETMSQLVPIPKNTKSLGLAGGKQTELNFDGMYAIEDGKLQAAELSMKEKAK